MLTIFYVTFNTFVAKVLVILRTNTDIIHQLKCICTNTCIINQVKSCFTSITLIFAAALTAEFNVTSNTCWVNPFPIRQLSWRAYTETIFFIECAVRTTTFILVEVVCISTCYTSIISWTRCTISDVTLVTNIFVFRRIQRTSTNFIYNNIRLLARAICLIGWKDECIITLFTSRQRSTGEAVWNVTLRLTCSTKKFIIIGALKAEGCIETGLTITIITEKVSLAKSICCIPPWCTQSTIV